ncbi:uncharacterized protein LOC119980295 isoform X2 [Tripterygium wilfordii]|uniref:uncharacterized protein LOC119980295 isoform X2 n=1 Tax=Tripterygium wilfordii TaxID=458696 RepID=UPI0018F859BC|nr:uncharacterized protein LOC119980295 isoform X2 [Tripterygium wilfordii]
MDDFSDEWKTMDDAAMKEKKSRHQMMGYRGLARRSRGSFDGQNYAVPAFCSATFLSSYCPVMPKSSEILSVAFHSYII